VRKYELLRFGGATKVETRRSVAGMKANPALRAAAKRELRYPPVRFTGEQALWVARGFADAVDRCGFRIYACAVLWDHAHFVAGRHRYSVERVTNQMKGAATRMLIRHGAHPLGRYSGEDGSMPSPWGEGLWKVFLDSNKDVFRAINYVRNNPVKHGLREQQWRFVTPYSPV
jgi:REP element-mobilizing transposase RayT